MNRKTARENTFILLFEHASKADETAEEIFDKATNVRELEFDDYVKRVFFGVNENLLVIDKCIESSLVGWKAARLSTVSRAVARLAVYELMFIEDIPAKVSINEPQPEEQASFSIIESIVPLRILKHFIS